MQSTSVRENLYNALWHVGVRVLHIGKDAGVTGTVERFLVNSVYRIIPPPDREVLAKIPLDMQMYLPPGFGSARTYMSGTYESEVTELMLQITSAGMTVVNVGAFCGYYVLISSRLVGTSGIVYAFEPDPTNYSYLSRNIQLNNCSNVEMINKAVWSISGEHSLIYNREADRLWISSERTASGKPISTVTLDDFFAERGWPPVDLVKMDIEGSEKAALEGMRCTSARNPQLRIIMELDAANLQRCGASVEEVATLLKELGFRAGYILEQHSKRFSVNGGFPKTRATYNLLLTKEG